MASRRVLAKGDEPGPGGSRPAAYHRESRRAGRERGPKCGYQMPPPLGSTQTTVSPESQVHDEQHDDAAPPTTIVELLLEQARDLAATVYRKLASSNRLPDLAPATAAPRWPVTKRALHERSQPVKARSRKSRLRLDDPQREPGRSRAQSRRAPRRQCSGIAHTWPAGCGLLLKGGCAERAPPPGGGSQGGMRPG